MDGILIQKTELPVELIIADDCSNDGTADRIRKRLENQLINYRFLEAEHNLGLGKNYLRGIESCEGEFVAFLEGDDYWTDPLRLQKHVNFLDENHPCPMTFNPFNSYHQSKGVLTTP